MLRSALVLTFMFLAHVAQAQLIYGQMTIANTRVPTTTGLTNGMSNGAVREQLFELWDATSAPNMVVAPLTAHLVLSGPTAGDRVAGINGTYNCCVSSEGWVLGSDDWVYGDVNSSQVVLAAKQIELASLGQQLRRYGTTITIDPGSTTKGSVFDAALSFDSFGSDGSQWTYMISVGDPEGTTSPVDHNTSIIHANSPAHIGNFCDCEQWQVDGYVFNFRHFDVTGEGEVDATAYGYLGPSGTVQGVSCTAGIVNPATMVVQGGIITHC